MSDSATDGGTDGTPIAADIIDSIATDENVPREDLADALSVFDASLTGAQSSYEEEYDSVAGDGVRGYVVDPGTWERLRDEHDIDARLAAAAQRAHTEQTQRLLSATAGNPADDRTSTDIDAGVVIETSE